MMRRGRARSSGPAGRGQATVETALLLPVVVLAVLAVIQVGLIVHARVMVTHAAREGARVAAVGGGAGEVRDAVVASGGLAPQRLEVDVGGGAGRVSVTVAYDAPATVPIIGSLIGDIELVGAATMRREG